MPSGPPSISSSSREAGVIPATSAAGIGSLSVQWASAVRGPMAEGDAPSREATVHRVVVGRFELLGRDGKDAGSRSGADQVGMANAARRRTSARSSRLPPAGSGAWTRPEADWRATGSDARPFPIGPQGPRMGVIQPGGSRMPSRRSMSSGSSIRTSASNRLVEIAIHRLRASDPDLRRLRRLRSGRSVSARGSGRRWIGPGSFGEAGDPGRRTHGPRTRRSMATPRCEAAYSASTMPTSTRAFIFIAIRPAAWASSVPPPARSSRASGGAG